MQQINQTITTSGGFTTTTGVIRIKYERGLQVYDVQKKLTFSVAFYRNAANANALVEDCDIINSVAPKTVYESQFTIDIVPPINTDLRTICENGLVAAIIANPPRGVVLQASDFQFLPDPI